MRLDSTRETDLASIAELARCLNCATPLDGRERCARCGREFPFSGAILDAIDELTGNNRVAASFYDGPGWVKFRPWERMFLRLVGGPKKARGEILRHLPRGSACRVLEVGIGDGENVSVLASNCELYGIDVSRKQLSACLDRFPSLAGRLAWAEAERLPFPDSTFDSVYTIGGFNYFSDPALALVEMHRVTRPGGPVIVADERPDLKNFGLGHLLGWKAYDAWWMRRVGLPPDFVEMISDTELDLSNLIRTTCPDAHRVATWKRLGYCLVDHAPLRRTPA